MRPNKLIRSVLALCALLGASTAVYAAPDENAGVPRITSSEARELAGHPAGAHGPVDLTESPRPLDRDFYYFAATWRNPTGSPMTGYYAVNPWTGDVWDVGGCKRLDSAIPRKRREGIRHESGVSKSLYSRLRERRPLCIGPKDR
jgi:hypothetical protein